MGKTHLLTTAPYWRSVVVGDYLPRSFNQEPPLPGRLFLSVRVVLIQPADWGAPTHRRLCAQGVKDSISGVFPRRHEGQTSSTGGIPTATADFGLQAGGTHLM